MFSIKFFHNTTLKINKNISNVLSTITRTKGVFVNQFFFVKGCLIILNNLSPILLIRNIITLYS